MAEEKRRTDPAYETSSLTDSDIPSTNKKLAAKEKKQQKRLTMLMEDLSGASKPNFYSQLQQSSQRNVRDGNSQPVMQLSSFGDAEPNSNNSIASSSINSANRAVIDVPTGSPSHPSLRQSPVYIQLQSTPMSPRIGNDTVLSGEKATADGDIPMNKSSGIGSDGSVIYETDEDVNDEPAAKRFMETNRPIPAESPGKPEPSQSDLLQQLIQSVADLKEVQSLNGQVREMRAGSSAELQTEIKNTVVNALALVNSKCDMASRGAPGSTNKSTSSDIVYIRSEPFRVPEAMRRTWQTSSEIAFSLLLPRTVGSALE